MMNSLHLEHASAAASYRLESARYDHDRPAEPGAVARAFAAFAARFRRSAQVAAAEVAELVEAAELPALPGLPDAERSAA